MTVHRPWSPTFCLSLVYAFEVDAFWIWFHPIMRPYMDAFMSMRQSYNLEYMETN